VTWLRTLTKVEAAEALLARNPGPGALEAFDTLYNVEQYTLNYTTINDKGEGTTASAAVFVPDVVVGTRLPLVSFSHGTQTDKQKVPSTLAFINPQGIINAAHGSVTVLADYLGMGVDAEHGHPYLVPSADARSTLDALRATRRFVKTLGLSLDGRLFLYGYSEGGGVAMQLAREIEENSRSGFRVTASAPMAGAYAVYEVGKEALSKPTPSVQGSGPTVYFLSSYQKVYHLADDMSQVLVPPFDALGEELITVGMTDARAASVFPNRAPRDVMQPAIIDGWVNDPESPVSRALRANQTYMWAPRAPMRLYYGAADVTVQPRNTILADSIMRDLGAADVQVVAWPGLNHVQAQWPSYISARRWFDTFPVTSDDEDENVDDDADNDDDHDRVLGSEAVLARHGSRP
jgi:pimeloyl-ACP methyl ester carboxylesterase